MSARVSAVYKYHFAKSCYTPYNFGAVTFDRANRGNDGRPFIKSEVIVSNYKRESANLWTYGSISPL